MMKHIWISYVLWLCVATAGVVAEDMPARLAGQVESFAGANAPGQAALSGAIEAALRAGADVEDVAGMIALASERGYSIAATTDFVTRVSTLLEANIPARMVRGKILEGMAKRVPAGNILEVVAIWSQALRVEAAEVADLARRGLPVADAGLREELINLGTVLARRHAIETPLSGLADHLSKPFAPDSGKLLGLAAQLAETLLLNGAATDQVMAMTGASLAEGLSVARMQQLQYRILDQLRQGFSATDIIARQREFLDNPSSLTPSMPGTIIREPIPDLLPGGRSVPSLPGTGGAGPGIGGSGIGGPASSPIPGGLPGVGGIGSLPLDNLPGPGLPGQ